MGEKVVPLTLTLTRRARLLATYGPGPRPCVDGAANWLGCTHCDQSCILAAGHQLDKAEIEKRRAALLAAREAEKARRKAYRFVKRGKLLRGRKAARRGADAGPDD